MKNFPPSRDPDLARSERRVLTVQTNVVNVDVLDPPPVSFVSYTPNLDVKTIFQANKISDDPQI